MPPYLLALALTLGQELVPDTRIILELGPSSTNVDGHGPAQTIEYDVTFTGKLYVWAASSDFDPRLSITDEGGRLLGQDDDSGGGTTAFLSFSVVPNMRLRITPSAAEAGVSGALVLHASEAVETEATLSAAERAREAEERAEEAKRAGDFGGARDVVARAVHELVAVKRGERSPALTEAALALGFTAYSVSDLDSAAGAWTRALEYLSWTLPDEHSYLLTARVNLAATTAQLGDFGTARAIFEQVLSIQSRTLPNDHIDLQRTRMNLAGTLKELGDLEGARSLQEQVVAVLSLVLSEDHPDLQRAKGNLASIIKGQGDLEEARALEEQVLAILSSTLPEDHPDLQIAQLSLASTIKELGDLEGARTLQEQVLAALSRILPDNHPDLQRARENLAVTITELGDLAAARVLEEQVLAAFSDTLPDDHPSLQIARLNLAITLKELGDLAGARALEERVLAVLSRTFPDDHHDLQRARGNLAGTIKAQGDLAGARALEEQVLAVFARTLSDSHPALLTARGNLAVTLYEQGELAAARVIEEQVLDACLRTLPDSHPALQSARGHLAATARELGEFDAARILFEQELAALSCALPDDHPDVQRARGNLAVTIAHQIASERLGEESDEVKHERSREFDALLCAFARGLRHSMSMAIAASSRREAEERVFTSQDDLSRLLSLAAGMGVFANDSQWEREAFLTSEAARTARLGSARIAREGHMDSGYDELHSKLREASAELARLAQTGADVQELDRARIQVEQADRDLVRRAAELSGGVVHLLQLDFKALASRVKNNEALVAYRSYLRETIGSGKRGSVQSLCAYVMRPNERLTRVELGPIEPIEAAVGAWRQTIVPSEGRGVGTVVGGMSLEESSRAECARGRDLRQMILDPLLPALAEADHIVLALDDVLHLTPIEALPLEEDPDRHFDLVGERWRIETRCTLVELLVPPARPNEEGALVALGGAAFDSEPLGASEAPPGFEGPQTIQAASVLRGGVWAGGFAPLPHTGLEARGIAALHAVAPGADQGAVVLDGRRASRVAMEELAPKARWLHVATHGWFASESIRSWQDPEPLDRHSGLGMRPSGEEQIAGMSPMLLCGIALSGANLPEDAVGRAPGLITAEELSTLDLSGCELVVLSACDTNVGVRRAGQGVASLQMALQMAGARSVITSLWKVPDEATKDLMLDFYRRMWVEKKPKWQALWEAKMKLRDARDEHGQPRYSTRDWAGWLLTGEPD